MQSSEPDLVSKAREIDHGSLEPQLWTRRGQHAVYVRNGFKHYGSNKNPNHVISDLNMTVAKGSIYGLLGASGCGKTTLLSCMVGRCHLNSGEIWVLGGEPGSKSSGVPGKRVGYMPQEISLYGEFSIRETLLYFGWILGMEKNDILDRLHFLHKFINLPSENQRVKNLSCGQQRRLSFAVALMHDPELLILDEPTVGVDPLLRQSIWKHFVEITKDGNRTVIITTHYIEEAHQAHTIGLMRNGCLLAEEPPHVLLSMYQCPTLEDVFLKLSRNQGNNSAANFADIDVLDNISALGVNKDDHVYVTEESGGAMGFHQSKEVLFQDVTKNQNYNDIIFFENLNLSDKSSKATTEICEALDSDCRDCFKITSKGKIRALVQKNFSKTWCNASVLLFVFVFPVIQVILICLSIGRDPTGLRLAIVNHEFNQSRTDCLPVEGCNFVDLGCLYFKHLNNNTIVQEFYPDVESAIAAVRRGDAWGALYIPDNFSHALVARVVLGKDAVDNETLSRAHISAWLDMSNLQIGLILHRDLENAFGDLATQLFKSCRQIPKLADLPIQYEKPIYGTTQPCFTDFVAPAAIITIVFYFAVALTSSTLIIERLEGMWDRSWVAGVKPFEILLSHVLTQLAVMCGQTALVLTFIIGVFGVECRGDIFWVVALTILQGLCGMCFGFALSAICELERDAMNLAMGSYYPILTLSGAMWPIEGIPPVLRYISQVLPLTMATTSLRSMFIRGWGISNPHVYCGFISTIIWIIVFLTITATAVKFKRR